MTLDTLITDAWQRKAAWLWLLLPFSAVYGLIILLRRYTYRFGLLASYRAPIPVMVIGNISVGGSGKTPLIISLVQYLQQRGVKVGVISRGYGGDPAQMPAIVTKHSLPSVVGDEPCLIVNTTGVLMAVCPNRRQAITTLLNAQSDIQLIIADDGLQHYALQRDIEWIVVDAARGFGNRQLLPTGFLREPLSRLKDSTVIYHKKPTHSDAAQDELTDANALTMQLLPSQLQPLITNEWLDNSDLSVISHIAATPKEGIVHGVSGIGYPQRFFATLSALGFEVIEHPYPDHYDFKLAELLQYTQYPIIVTSKDAVKIKALWQQQVTNRSADNDESISSTAWDELAARLWVLPVSAVLSMACYRKLDEQLSAFDINMIHSN